MTGRPWTAVVCGAPDARTLLIVDWLMFAAREAGMVAHALPLGPVSGPYGMYVEIAPPGSSLTVNGGLPSGGVDLLVAGEHAELARALAAGYAHHEMTTVVTSCQRNFTEAEERMLPGHVLAERDIDRAAQRSARRYVAFDAAEVCGWYRLSEQAQPGLLLGAALGADAVAVPPEAIELAITKVGIDVAAARAGLERGHRFGRRSGGRVRRTLTAAQFVRTRRGALPREERAPFEALVDRVERELPEVARPAVRAGVALLSDYQSVEYAEQYVQRCVAAARAEQCAVGAGSRPADPEDSVLPVVARHLAAMLAYPDLARVAQLKLAKGRLRAIRRFHGVSREEPYSVRELLPVDAYERAQLAPAWRSGHADRTGSPLLCATTLVEVDPTTLRGALRLRMLRAGRKRRQQSSRHVAELDTADAYVATVCDVLATAPELTELVAASGSLVQGYGAVRAASRATAEAFWGRVVRQALAVDRSAPDGIPHVTRLIVPTVYARLVRTGPLALWDYAAQVVGIALHCSRGGTYEEALTFARVLCGVADTPSRAERHPPAERTGPASLAPSTSTPNAGVATG